MSREFDTAIKRFLEAARKEFTHNATYFSHMPFDARVTRIRNDKAETIEIYHVLG